jgi:hypothetical protein
VIVRIHSCRGIELPDTVSLPSTEVGHEDGDRPKKRRKERAKRGKNHEAENQHSNVVEEDNAQQNDKLVSLLSVL